MDPVTAAPARPRLVTLTSVELADHLSEALEVYVAAMGYPPGTARQRRNLWLEHSRRPGWRCVGWLDPAGRLIGVAYGYSGGPGQWWFEEVRRGLAARGTARELHQPDWLHDYFELTELHVRPDAQGSRLGEQMLRALLAGVRHETVLLSTPEYGPRPPGRAWRLYRRLGFADVLRDHRFTGDSRPFAVLGRALPLDPVPDHPAREA
jgi:ribosomal protein S18 acetylase RimI-like enzyme